MKIDVTSIIVDHLRTLRNFPSDRVSLSDVCLFYVLPVAIAILAYYSDLVVKADFYNVSITFFGIFVALLLNIQVAIFGIFIRKWDSPSDVKSALSVANKLDQRKLLLGEINSNVSYLILVCCVSLIISLVAYTKSHVSGTLPALTVLIYTHFMLTLFMIIKRVYAIFQKEYS